MKVKKDEKGFISEFTLVGNLVDGIEIEEPAEALPVTA